MPTPIPDPREFFGSLLVQYGAPVFLVAAVLTVLKIADWLRFGRDVTLLSTAAGRRAAAVARGVATSADRGGRSAWVFAVLTETAWVLMVFLAWRAMLVMSGTAGSEYTDWLSRLHALIVGPSWLNGELQTWTSGLFFTALGLVLTLNVSLWASNPWVANVAMMSMFTMTGLFAGVAGPAAILFAFVFVGLGVLGVLQLGTEVGNEILLMLSHWLTVPLFCACVLALSYTSAGVARFAPAALFPGFRRWFGD